MPLLHDPGEQLRQGDICGTRAFPTWRLRDAHAVTNFDGVLTHIQLPHWDRVVQVDGYSLVAICSHDCDVENPRNRAGLLLAPLIEIPASPIETEKRQQIMDSAKPVDDRYSWINLFPLVLEGRNLVIEMSAMDHYGPIRHAVEYLNDSKRAEMTDDTRSDFRLKLAAFFGRPDD